MGLAHSLTAKLSETYYYKSLTLHVQITIFKTIFFLKSFYLKNSTNGIYFQLLHRQIYLHWAKTALADFQLLHPLTVHCGFLEVLLHGRAEVEFPLQKERKKKGERKEERYLSQYVGKFLLFISWWVFYHFSTVWLEKTGKSTNLNLTSLQSPY